MSQFCQSELKNKTNQKKNPSNYKNSLMYVFPSLDYFFLENELSGDSMSFSRVVGQLLIFIPTCTSLYNSDFLIKFSLLITYFRAEFVRIHLLVFLNHFSFFSCALFSWRYLLKPQQKENNKRSSKWICDQWFWFLNKIHWGYRPTVV